MGELEIHIDQERDDGGGELERHTEQEKEGED